MPRRSFALKTFLALALLFLALLLGFGVWRKVTLDQASRELALNTTESLFTGGSARQLIVHAHGDLLAQQSAQALAAYIDSISRLLGSLDTISSIAGNAETGLLPLPGAAVTASYQIELVFAGNPATAVIEMVLEGEDWLFTAYRIESELLFN